MSKKRKSRAPGRSPSKIRGRAAKALQRGNFREAVELHKQLLKEDSQPAVVDGLASAYLGRAGELADKGMYKEAAALWENMAGSCGEREPGRYIEWLLLGGRVERGARQLLEAGQDLQASPDGVRASGLLALILLAQPDAVGDALPSASPWWGQREAMLEALKAYCANDDHSLHEALKRIPFRSPYRDLRTFLQALAKRDSDSNGSRQDLARIPPDSPLAPLAAEILGSGVDADPSALLGHPAPVRDLLMSLQGITPQRRRALAQAPARDKQNPKSILRFALTLQDVDEAHLRRFCLAWLPLDPQSQGAVEKRFGPLSTAERERIKALVAEQKHDLGATSRHWERCADALLQDGQPLAAALTLRHLAAIHEIAKPSLIWDNEVPGFLERSLALDPDDRTSYLKLAELARGRVDSRAEYEVMARAAKQFPADVEILLLTGDVAYRKKTPKEAAKHARTVLKQDSRNFRARSLLLMSHVAMARQQVKRGRHHLAHDTLRGVESQMPSGEFRAIHELVRGLIFLSEKNRDQAHHHLGHAIETLGNGLDTRFRFLVHGRRMHLKQATLTRTYNQLSPARQEPTPTPETLMRLARLIKALLVDGDEDILDTLDQLQKPLKEVSRLRLQETEFHTLLDTLFDVEHYALLARFAQTATRVYPENPRFIYYEIFGQLRGDDEALDFRDLFRLRQARDDAAQRKDLETVELINDFLDEGYGDPLGLNLDLPPELPPMPPDVRELFERAMDELGIDDPFEMIRLLAEMEEEDDDDLAGFPFPLPKNRGRRR